MSNPAFERILVTGGTGFIGRYTVDLLVSDGLAPLVTTSAENVRGRQREPLNVDIVELDLTDAGRTFDLIASYKPQIVLHLAGVTGHDDTTGRKCHDVNFVGTTNLLNALDRHGVSRVILIGTAAEYGGQPTPFTEDMAARPVSPYAISKAKANQAAMSMHAANGLPATILRVFTAYGIGQPDKMFLSQLISHALLNSHFTMSTGLQKRDFVYAEDAARAIRSAMTAENTSGRIINIAGGMGVVLRDLAWEVWKTCGADIDLLEIGTHPKTGDDAFDTEADISLAREILNWSPGEPILNGSRLSPALTEMIQDMRTDLGSVTKTDPSRPARR